MEHARDKGRMAVLPGPLDGLCLRLEVAEHVVGVILHHKVFNGASLGTTFGARFHIDIRHSFSSSYKQKIYRTSSITAIPPAISTVSPGPGCVKSRTDAMILFLNRQA